MSISLKFHPKKDFNPATYILHEELRNAVEVAIALGQPLLLTGEPGTGKTLLASKVAHILHEKEPSFGPKPLIFHTKTTSTARDLFYTYDAISHFQEANIKRQSNEAAPPMSKFIELQALGKAIAFSNPKQEYQQYFETRLPESPKSSVVLIDEIDKAPRDFTNDILNEIDKFEFRIKEQNAEIKMDRAQQVVAIMTSNSEKNLPDAFLRRCVFYHIPFPDKALLQDIITSQLGIGQEGGSRFSKQAIESLVTVFKEVRKRSIRKSPATAELIGWLRILEIQDYLNQDIAGQKALIEKNLSILVKTREDLDAVKQYSKEILNALDTESTIS
jgi:MoxR-like ATPase